MFDEVLQGEKNKPNSFKNFLFFLYAVFIILFEDVFKFL